jgi:hypothetical protein
LEKKKIRAFSWGEKLQFLFYFYFLFPMCSHQVLNVFPNMFPIAPQDASRFFFLLGWGGVRDGGERNEFSCDL